MLWVFNRRRRTNYFQPYSDGLFDEVTMTRRFLNRRNFLTTTFAAGALAPVLARQQPTEISPYQPRDWSGTTPIRYPDRDIIALDPRFRRYVLVNTPSRRHYTGTLWAEGPAWNGVGRYLVWSDIPNDR